MRLCLFFARQLEDCLRLVGSLKLGRIPAAGIMRTLQVGDRLTRLARAVFHGKRGELRQRYQEGQEDQLGALGLVVNMIVLWNTLYIEAVLDQLRKEGYPVQDEDVPHFPPLMYEHINMLGRYPFAVPESVERGELRPLKNPTDHQEP